MFDFGLLENNVIKKCTIISLSALNVQKLQTSQEMFSVAEICALIS